MITARRTKYSFIYAMAIPVKIVIALETFFWFGFSMRHRCCPYFLHFLGSMAMQCSKTVRSLMSFVMVTRMFLGSHYNKIFNSVVISFPINMMNYFALFELATKVFSHYKNMLSYITVIVGSRVVFFLYKYISSLISFSSFPMAIKIFFELVSRYVGFWKSFNRVFVSIDKFSASARTHCFYFFKTRPFGVFHTMSVSPLQSYGY